MSCLSNDALSHFEQREQELLAQNQELDTKRARAVAEASGAVQQADAAFDRHRLPSPAADLAPPMMAEFGGPTSSAEAALANALVTGAMPKGFSDGGDAGSEALHETVRSQHLRILALQEELSKTISELAARSSEVQDLRQEANKASVDHQRLQKAHATLEQTQEREKKRMAEIDRKSQDTQREISDLNKERDTLDVQKRKLEAELVSKDARVNRLTEECERYKAAAKDLGNQDRDRAVADRRETDRLQGEVRKLERQRAELVNAFKKQMKLIDVLKRQRAHVEAARVLSFTEDEFIRILELGDKLGE